MLRLSYKVWSNNNCFLTNSNTCVILVTNRCYAKKLKSADSENVDFLVKLLGVEHYTAARIALRHKRLKKLAHDDIKEAHAICAKYGFGANVISEFPKLLLLRPFLLERRARFYEDMGCSIILPQMISEFFPHTELTVKEFKEQKLLPEDADVTKNLFKSLRDKSLPTFESMPDDSALSDIHIKILRHYVKWKLNITEERLNQIMASPRMLRCPSFSIIAEMMDMLENVFGFTKEKININNYLICKSPTNARRILEEIEYFGDCEAKSLILRYPRILHIPAKTLLDKLEVLKEFNVRDEAIGRCPEIFTLAIKTIRKRLIEFETIDDLKVHSRHSRFLSIIFAFETVKKRLVQLKELNVRCNSLHILCCSEKAFSIFQCYGRDKIRYTDLLKYFAYEFGLEYRDDRILVIKRHPHSCSVPLLHIDETFGYLREQNYSNQDILENIQITLYRRSQIQQEFDNINTMKIDPEWKMTRSQRLALCLYNIEKAYHFNGSGVWNYPTTDFGIGIKDEENHNFRSLRHTSNV